MTDTPTQKRRRYSDVQMHMMCVSSLLAIITGVACVVVMAWAAPMPSQTPVAAAGLPMTWGALVIGWVLFANRRPSFGIILCLAAPILWAAMAYAVL